MRWLFKGLLRLVPTQATSLKWRGLGLATFVILGLFAAGPASSQNITQLQALTFGDIVVIDNTAKQRVTVDMDGTVTSDAGIYRRTQGSSGLFWLTGFPPSISIVVEIDPVVLSVAGDGQGKIFTVGFSYFPLVTTDINGEALFDFGAILMTSGDGTVYGGDSYTGGATISISW